MKSLLTFIDDFLKNKGHRVFLSLLIAKICGFLGSLFIIRILPVSEFGTVSIVASIFTIFVSFSGAGSQQSLLRFGSITDDEDEKRSLAQYLLKNGFIYQIFASLIFFVVSLFYLTRYEDIFFIFLFFNIRLIGFYFLIYIQAYFRVYNRNKDFARVSNVINISGVVFLLILSYFFGLTGYLIAAAVTPFLALFWFKKEYFSKSVKLIGFKIKDVWNYGVHSAGNTLLSDALFSVDVLLLSFLMSESVVANYKVAILIPTNITFLAATFMQSDYAIIAKNSKNKSFLSNYIFNYYKIFIPVSLMIFIVGYIFRVEIITFFFSLRYSEIDLVFAVFLAAFCFNMLMRNLYSNLLAAVGLIKINVYISALSLILLVLFSLFLVNIYGIMGMAFSLCLSMIFGGFIFMIVFYYYWKALK